MHRSSRRLPFVPTRLAASFALAAALAAQSERHYPTTTKVDHVDTYFGVKVPDPFRWLEDDRSEQTAAWVKAQNEVTFAHLARIPFRAQLQARLRTLYDYPKFTAPLHKAGKLFFQSNTGLQNQNVLYVQNGREGTPEVLLDPNSWSEDGTVRLTVFAPSRTATHAVYGISRSGSDWQELRVLDLATKKTLDDKLAWVKVSGVAWRGDGFFYSRYPAPAKGQELSSKNENHQVFYHRVGTAQAEDQLVYEDPAHPQRFHQVGTTQDERFAILTISERGMGKKGNALFVRDLTKDSTSFSPLVPVVGDDSYSVVDAVGESLLLNTNRGAPNRRIVLVDPKEPAEARWKTVLPERSVPLESASTTGGKLFATYLNDVTAKTFVFDRAGTLENELALPGLGAVGGFGGERDATFTFYTYTSFDVPPTIWLYDLASRKSTIFREPKIPAFRAADYETEQVFYASKDKTRVPMFLVHKKGLKLDGKNPTLLYGYGGFSISQNPSFSALRIALLEQGFVYAVACLRGGDEYGEKWHAAGTKLQKQNVFDDFIAAAEWLIENRYASPATLAIQGGSNGGLLVGAVMNQRPELFHVAIPQVGVMDMLRFHKFTIGWNWIADYGSSDDEAEFKALFAYSPLHNIKAGSKYPATLITTADHDDRVVPAHSFKYAATLQERADPASPVLIRIETKSGHGASSTTKNIETTADVYAFLMHELGITPSFGAR